MIPRDIADFQIENWLHDCTCPAHSQHLFVHLVRSSGFGCAN